MAELKSRGYRWDYMLEPSKKDSIRQNIELWMQDVNN